VLDFIHQEMHATYRSFLDEYRDLFELLRVVDSENKEPLIVFIVNDLKI